MLAYIFKQFMLARKFSVPLQMVDYLSKVVAQALIINAFRNWCPSEVIMVLLFVAEIKPYLRSRRTALSEHALNKI